jgi:hypothetical protein
MRPPLFTSPHARPLVSACTPCGASKDRNPIHVPACVHRVTAAPTPSYIGRVIHVAALRGQAVTGSRRCERLLAACSGVLGWVSVQCHRVHS